MATTKKRARGFVLLIVIICSVAMVVIAVALAFTAGANKIVSVKGSSIDRSETIAVSGMERAVAYAERVVEVERDFDLVLDPGQSINCKTAVESGVFPARGGSPSVAKSGLPRWSDSNDDTFDGVNYAVVPFSDGAYLVRFDDDADDFENNLLLGSFTNNRQSNDCKEGPDFATALGDDAANNPYRDRNRAVWISVIGIYPGTDPSRAPHRTALRRYHVSTVRPPSPGLTVFEDIEIDGDLQYCSNLGDIAAGEDLEYDTTAVTCGASTAGAAASGSVAAQSTADTACGGADQCMPVQAPVGGAPLPAFVIPPINSASWLNEPIDADGDPATAVAMSCNLFAKDGAGGGLWFWDATRTSTAGGASEPCANNAITNPVADPNGGDPGSDCWAPLFLIDASNALQNPMGWTEVTTSWTPTNAAETKSLAVDTTVGTITLPAAFEATKPDWSRCTVRWKGSFAAAKGCNDATAATERCNGSNAVATVDAGSGRIVFDLTKPMAMPAVVVRFAAADLKVSEHFVFDDMPSGSDALPDEWGLGTWLIDGKLTVDADAHFGIGMDHAVFASVVVDDELKVESGDSGFFAGSVIVRDGDLKLESGSYSNGSGSSVSSTRAAFNGLVTVGGDLEVDNSSRFFMDYDEDLAGVSDLRAMPSMSRTVR